MKRNSRCVDGRLASSSHEWRPSYLSHGRLSDLVRVLPDALQEVLQVRHGHLLDVLAQSGQVLSHNLAEAVLADPAAAEKQQSTVFPQLRHTLTSARRNRWSCGLLSTGSRYTLFI